jgi:hypothetical protein
LLANTFLATVESGLRLLLPRAIFGLRLVANGFGLVAAACGFGLGVIAVNLGSTFDNGLTACDSCAFGGIGGLVVSSASFLRTTIRLVTKLGLDVDSEDSSNCERKGFH